MEVYFGSNVRSVRARSARISFISHFHVNVTKLQKWHSYATHHNITLIISALECTRMLRNLTRASRSNTGTCENHFCCCQYQIRGSNDVLVRSFAATYTGEILAFDLIRPGDLKRQRREEEEAAKKQDRSEFNSRLDTL